MAFQSSVRSRELLDLLDQRIGIERARIDGVELVVVVDFRGRSEFFAVVVGELFEAVEVLDDVVVVADEGGDTNLVLGGRPASRVRGAGVPIIEHDRSTSAMRGFRRRDLRA